MLTFPQASSNEEALEELMDADLEDNYWESDGNQGDHWLRFHMKPSTIIDKFALLVDPDDSSYLPRRVVIKVGSQGSMSTLTTRNFTASDFDTKELQLFLSPLTVHYDIIEVHVKSCYQGGIDTRIRGVSVTTRTSESVILDSEALSEDVFTPERITRYPKLQPFEPKQLFRRGLILKRIAYLLDIDHNYLLPRSQLTTTSKLDLVQVIRQLWPLCKKRNGLIQQLLSDSATSPPSRPTVYINRMAAKEHLEDPSKDPESKKTIFNQLMRELKKHTKPHNFNFRWAGSWTQWWECKFMQEGMIDQGGGFRDTLAEIAEELCPSNPDSEVALPLFIRSPNQSQDSSNVYRDAYIPNPSCTQFARYEFVGKLMGAMLRSHESLVLSLPQFVWKQLVGDSVTWARDFISVDSAEVKFINSIETMSREVFEASFEGALKFTTVLSNGKTISLVPGEDGDRKLVSFDSRSEYCKLAKESRMNESKEQIKAIKDGLTKVVPTEVLSLLTWQELETKICGNPEILVDALKKSARYDSMLNENSPRVKVMWEALEKFNNDDRSRFLRFITGRRRLPCTIFIDSAEGSSKLPTSATCSNVLYLPKYDNVEEAVDRLKYAAYNCVAIDTDMTPSGWD
jgi:E3 ubiquitin-protein ligase HECTD3